MQKQDYYQANSEHLKALPDYVTSYYRAKLSNEMSQVTLYHYLYTFDEFFNWLRATGISKAKDNASVPLSDLERLSLADAQLFKSDLLQRPKYQGKNKSSGLKKSSLTPFLAGIKSLFKYLAVESEQEATRQPLISRNVMDKIPLPKNHETLNARAEKMSGHLLVGEKDIEFVQFLEHDYEHKLSDHQRPYFLKNKTRDIAIIALFLATGMRLSELCNLNMENLHLDDERPSVDVTRKGNVQDNVSLRLRFLPFVREYLAKRTALFPDTKDSKVTAVFLASRSGKSQRINTRTVQNMVKKYSTAFKVPMHTHLLRHSVASKLYSASGHDSQLVQTQLGQRSPSATMMYEHTSKEHQSDVLGHL